MKINYKLTIAAAVFSAALPALASAEHYSKSVVLDARGNAVTTKEGVCVTHNFPEENNNICNGGNLIDELSIPNVVYFDFDKSTLNPKGQQVVAEVATALKKLPSYKINLAGNTDTVASASYNQILSEKRAASVKGALIAAGIDATKITTVGFGETKNAVPTKDSVPEALNRRVEIEVTN
jgi:outer membrane protein OmpA-like peptidoglycan-associated protein